MFDDRTHAAYMEAYYARQRLAGAEPPRPPRPAVPTLPVILAPVPDWMGIPTPPPNCVTNPGTRIAFYSGGIKTLELALDGIPFRREGYTRFTDPASQDTRHQPAAPLAPGEHLVTVRWVDEAGARDSYSWSFEVRRTHEERRA